MIGQKFGNLVIKSKDELRSGKNIYFICDCDCGKSISVRKNSLQLGNTKSCGCITRELKKQTRSSKTYKQQFRPHLQEVNKKRAEEHSKTFIGKKYSFLTIASVEGIFFNCICDCKKTKRIRRSSVISEKTTSCGCQRLRLKRESRGLFKSWIGKKFTMLTVMEDLPNHRAVVRCECGTEKEVHKTYLRKGNIKSCGCKAEEMRLNTNLIKYGSRTRGVCTSKAEIEIMTWVKSLGLKAEKAYIDPSLEKDRSEIDVLIPEINLGIEHNGLKWHTLEALIQRLQTKEERVNNKVTKKTKRLARRYHLLKTQKAAEKGIRLIHIWDFEWKERKQAVKSYIRSAMGLNSRKIGARKIELRLIDRKISSEFLNKYHIQGNSSGFSHVGVYLKDELLAVATFGLHHRNGREVILRRWCVKEDVTIAGGLSKVMKGISKLGVNTDYVYTWADLRLSNGKGYDSSGWELDKKEDLDYFYYNPNTKENISKQSRKKSNVNTPSGMKEWEHAKLDGLERVYDCGKLRYKYKL